MIKTYKLNILCNNASHTLTGAGGNTMRYNFTHGNTYTGKKPELTIRSKYAQDLLESHELFKSGKVTLVRSTPEPSDFIDDEQKDPGSDPKKIDDVIEVPSVTSADELLAFVNEKDNREGSRMFKSVSNAFSWATEHNYSFPNYKS